MIPFQDYCTHVACSSFFNKTISLSVHEPINHKNLPPRTGLQDLLVTQDDFEDRQENCTPHKYAINQVTQCESESQDIESATVVATLYSKARVAALTGYKLTGKLSEKKVHCSQFSNGNKNRLDHEYFSTKVT